MKSRQNLTLWLFSVFAMIHIAIVVILPFAFSSFNDRVNWWAINAIPWWPLYELGLPVTHTDWLMRPNILGWIWCALVWTGVYALAARGIATLVLRQRGPGIKE